MELGAQGLFEWTSVLGGQNINWLVRTSGAESDYMPEQVSRVDRKNSAAY